MSRRAQLSEGELAEEAPLLTLLWWVLHLRPCASTQQLATASADRARRICLPDAEVVLHSELGTWLAGLAVQAARERGQPV